KPCLSEVSGEMGAEPFGGSEVRALRLGKKLCPQSKKGSDPDFTTPISKKCLTPISDPDFKKGSDPGFTDPISGRDGFGFLASALVLAQEFLAQPNALRRDLDELVVVDELERLLEREANRRREQDVLVVGRRTDVRQMLFLRRVDRQVVAAAVDADDHAFVDLVARTDEEQPSLLKVEERIARGAAVDHRHEHADVALTDFRRHARRITIEHVIEQAGAGRDGQVLGPEADQASRGNAVFEAHASTPVPHHAQQLAAPLREPAHHRPLTLLGEVDRHALPRRVDLAVDAALDHGRPRYRELVALAPHRLDQHGEMELAAPRHAKLVRVLGGLDAQRDVVLRLLLEARANLTAREVLAFASRERRLVDLERHRDRRLVDLELRQPLRVAPRADRVRYAEVVDAAEHDDVAGPGRLDRLSLETFEAVKLAELRVLDAPVPPHEIGRA